MDEWSILVRAPDIAADPLAMTRWELKRKIKFPQKKSNKAKNIEYSASVSCRPFDSATWAMLCFSALAVLATFVAMNKSFGASDGSKCLLSYGIFLLPSIFRRRFSYTQFLRLRRAGPVLRVDHMALQKICLTKVVWRTAAFSLLDSGPLMPSSISARSPPSSSPESSSWPRDTPARSSPCSPRQPSTCQLTGWWRKSKGSTGALEIVLLSLLLLLLPQQCSSVCFQRYVCVASVATTAVLCCCCCCLCCCCHCSISCCWQQ